ncbi:hypothetical protein Cni_G24071 [Canna indica]|uniref:Uncharacterized protein n=1 Tax=Canna indica TaxID=4628 RepID=A0AAQ3KVI5_9LILI|nr:hypothetical protein Cni_G24071 [Canna indica]
MSSSAASRFFLLLLSLSSLASLPLLSSSQQARLQEFQPWHLVFVGIGLLFLQIAPFFSSWTMFYYSTSIALGVLFIVLTILIQVSVVVAVAIILGGTVVGYWIVRKLVISNDGSVNVVIAWFVKWAMRSIGVGFILLSAHDAPLTSLSALALLWNFCSIINLKKWGQASRKNGSPIHEKHVQASPDKQAEFLSPMSKEMRIVLSGISNPYAFSVSPTEEGKSYSSFSKRATLRDQSYYSTYHKLPMRKFSKKEWENFSHESTSTALKEWASTPEVARWIADNAHRMRLDQGNNIYDDETTVEIGSGGGFFKWLLSRALS